MNLASRDEFGSPVPRQPAHLYTQAESGAYLHFNYSINMIHSITLLTVQFVLQGILLYNRGHVMYFIINSSGVSCFLGSLFLTNILLIVYNNMDFSSAHTT